MCALYKTVQQLMWQIQLYFGLQIIISNNGERITKIEPHLTKLC